jgi:hypothetical protein
MKKYKNLLLFGAIGVALYYLLKKDKPSTVSGTTSTTETTDTSDGLLQPMVSKPQRRFINDDFPTMGMNVTYGVPSGISLKR